MSKNTPSVYFKKTTDRKIEETVLPVRPYQSDYDNYENNKNAVMQKLNRGYV